MPSTPALPGLPLPRLREPCIIFFGAAVRSATSTCLSGSGTTLSRSDVGVANKLLTIVCRASYVRQPNHFRAKSADNHVEARTHGHRPQRVRPPPGPVPARRHCAHPLQELCVSFCSVFGLALLRDETREAESHRFHLSSITLHYPRHWSNYIIIHVVSVVLVPMTRSSSTWVRI